MNNRLRSPQKRSGATLVEVLMSLLIFSIGIVSVFTLFPVSLLSSIQATKLTNSKILSDNVVELVRTNPGILHPPHPRNSTTYTLKGEWQPNTAYSVDDYVTPRATAGNLYPQPFLVYVCTTAGTSGSGEPTWLTSGSITDGTGSLEWQTISLNSDNSNYVVDPLGRHLAGDDTAKTFGSNNATLLGFGSDGLSRTDGTVGSFPAAQGLFAQPDTWTAVIEEVPSGVTATSVTFPASVDIGGISATNHRVVVKSLDGRRAASRSISNRSGQTINLSGGNLPGWLDSPGEVGSVRVESFNTRYSYFITVRRPGAFDKPTITAVMVFNRSFALDDEEVYDANFGNSGYTDDTTVQDGGLGTDQIKVAWDGENKAPLMREGNYVFDARNALWYQITNIQRDDANENAVITVDRSIEVLTTSSQGLGRAIFMPGIVKVFEL